MLTKRFAHPLGTVCALALMLLSFTAFAQPAKGKGREIVGTIVDVDSSPVANATVSIAGGPTATTATDGSFKLTGVATTNLAIDVTADGFTAKQVPILAATTALQLQVVLVKPVVVAPPPVVTRMVGGVVSDAGHAPVAGATVRVHGTTIQAQTNADGSFTLPGVAIAEVTLDVEAPNQPPTTVTVGADRAAVVVTVGAPMPASPTTRTIRGKVVDDVSGEPIVAAQVGVAGGTNVVFTEADGAFSIEGVSAGAVKLEVSAPEHVTATLNVPEGKDTVSIPLSISAGEQIVVEGRAPSITKQNITGGGSVIDGKDLTRVSAATLDDAMTGKLAGANLQSNSGAPGGGAQLRLRGISTINGQSSPLYVIDGVIISNVATSGGTNALTGAAAGIAPSTQDNAVNRISDLNPNDIENIEVLKGASAAALYGSKAANGVVIITTKRGRQGENHASVTQRFGIAQVSKRLGSRTFTSLDEVKTQFCGPTDSMDKCNANAYVQAYIAGGGKVYDHEAEIERTPFSMETLANVSGGTENGNYLGSVLITDTPGVEIGTFYKKQSGRIAVGYKFGDRVRVGLTANVIHSLSDRGVSNNDNVNVSNFIVLGSTPSFIDLNAKNGIYPANIPVSANPLQTVALLKNREDVWRMITGATGAVDAYSSPDGQHKVKVVGNLGADSFDQKNNLLSPNALTYEADDKLLGTIIDGTTTNLNWNTGASVAWSYTPQSGKFRSALTGGVTYESVDLKSNYVFGRNLTSGQPSTNAVTAVSTNQNYLSTRDTGFYGQEELSLLDDRLSVLGGLLAERSSLNGDTDKYYLYPKIGAAYSLIKPAKAGETPMLAGFESLRARAAYGETGNRPNYGNKFTPLSAVNSISGNGGLVIGGAAGDTDIEPERQREIELGVDVATKNQRVVAELTGYQRGISNMLLQRTLPQSVGFTTQFLNGGSLRNRGLEAAVSVKPVVNSMVEWTTRGTLTLNRSEVTSLPAGITPFNVPVGFGSFGLYRIEVGKSATQIVTGDGNGNLIVAGNGEPDFRVGWSNIVTAGDFTLSTLLDWQQGSKVINLTRNGYDAAGLAPDQAAAAQRLATFKTGDGRPYIEDGSFLKVREISIAYTLPKRFVSQLGPVKNLQLSLSGRNLLTLTHYSGMDPEVSNFGGQAIARNIDVAPYPPSRVYWFSVTAGI